MATGRDEKTTFCIVNAQSVKITDTAQEKGYDAGRKVSGIKRHIAVDSQGLPHAVQSTTADAGDREGALPMFLLNDNTLSNVDDVMVAGRCTGKPYDGHVDCILGATVEVATRSALHKLAVFPSAGSWSDRLPGLKMLASAEALRTRAAYAFAIRRAYVSGLDLEKTLNTFLEC